MSSDLLSALTTVRQNNYVSLAVLTVVGYDYVLTFSKEIEYIWTKPWTFVSVLFVLVRYCGILNLALSSISGTSFIPGPAKFSAQMVYNQTVIPYTITPWSFSIFVAPADFIMLLRIWAMYNRSKLIIRVLLAFISIEIISAIVTSIIYSLPQDTHSEIGQLQEYSFCVTQVARPISGQITNSLQIAFGVVMCIFAIVQSVRLSLQMYRSTKQLQFNQYISLLLKQGIVYFLAIFLMNLADVLSFSGRFPDSGWGMIVMIIVQNVPVFTLIPRFIISIREMYARNVHSERAGGIDTGFGLATVTGDGAAGTAIVFAEAGENEMEDIEEVPMGDVTPAKRE